MTTTMPMPDWATDEARGQTADMLDGTAARAGAIQFVPVTNFSSHFAEWTFRGSDLLVHLFPRTSLGDAWTPTRYDAEDNYIPARREEKATVAFPGDMRDRILAAVDKTWMGDVAIDLVHELGAYAVQFQDAKTVVHSVGPGKFVDTFCEAIDAQLE